MSRGRAALALLALAGEARADRPPPAVRHLEVVDAPRTEGDGSDPEQQHQPFLSLRLMPMQIIAGIGQVGAEVVVIDKFSLLAHAGVGRVNVVDVASGAKVRKTFVDVDLQGRYYPVGDISGGIYGGLGAAYTPRRLRSAHLVAADEPRLGAPCDAQLRRELHLALARLGRPPVHLRLPPPRAHPQPAHARGIGLRANDLRIGAALALGYLF